MSAETDWSAVADAAYRDWADSERNEKLETLEAEVIRLRAEVEENEKVINVWRRRTERAEAEADALGPDAMRWRHVRDMDPDAVGPAHHVVECGSDSWGNPYYEYVTGEEADQVIDAAMGASA